MVNFVSTVLRNITFNHFVREWQGMCYPARAIFIFFQPGNPIPSCLSGGEENAGLLLLTLSPNPHPGIHSPLSETKTFRFRVSAQGQEGSELQPLKKLP